MLDEFTVCIWHIHDYWIVWVRKIHDKWRQFGRSPKFCKNIIVSEIRNETG